MQILMFAVEILTGKVNESPVLADWLADHLNDDTIKILKFLREPTTLRIRTVLNVVEKFGSRKERRLMSRAFRKTMKNRNRHSKGATYAFMKKAYSLHELTYHWFPKAFAKQLIAQELKRKVK